MSKGRGRMVAGNSYVPSLIDDYMEQAVKEAAPPITQAVRDVIERAGRRQATGAAAAMCAVADAGREAAKGLSRAFEMMRDAALGASDAVMAWRRDVDAEQIPELVDTDTAMTAIAAGAQKKIFGRTIDEHAMEQAVSPDVISRAVDAITLEYDPSGPTPSNPGMGLGNWSSNDHVGDTTDNSALHELKRDDLRKMAGKRGIPGYRAMTKAQLIEALS